MAVVFYKNIFCYEAASSSCRVVNLKVPTIRYITGLVAEEISPTTNRSQSVSATKQVLITLRFLASGSFQQVTGDTVAGLNKSSASKITRRVTLALSRKLDQFAMFSETEEERDSIKQGLHEIVNFPCAIGIIDASHSSYSPFNYPLSKKFKQRIAAKRRLR